MQMYEYDLKFIRSKITLVSLLFKVYTQVWYKKFKNNKFFMQIFNTSTNNLQINLFKSKRPNEAQSLQRSMSLTISKQNN